MKKTYLKPKKMYKRIQGYGFRFYLPGKDLVFPDAVLRCKWPLKWKIFLRLRLVWNYFWY